MNLKYVVKEEDEGKQLKYILKNKLKLSERLTKKLKYNQKVLCNSIPVFINTVVKLGDIVEVNVDFVEESQDVIPEDIPLNIIYEDDFLIILNKQPNIVVHPTSTHPSGTIANGIMYYFLNQGISKKIRPVSRLDRDTSGIIVFAKNQFIQEQLIQQMNHQTFKKEYIGIVYGRIEHNSGTIDLPIERKPGSIMLRYIASSGNRSITHYDVLEYLNDATLLKFRLETGRTHQIRVHCQAIGHSLFGDTLYSDIETNLIGRQALHSLSVNFTHPYTGNILNLKAPIPQDINNLITQLKI